MTGIILPSELLKLLTSTVGDLLVGRAHLCRVNLSTAILALGAVEGWKESVSQSE